MPTFAIRRPGGKKLYVEAADESEARALAERVFAREAARTTHHAELRAQIAALVKPKASCC